MVSVASLLNPLPTPLEKGQLAASQKPKSVPASSTSTAYYGNKMSKSAAVFFKGRTKGAINYKPCEIQNETIAAEHRKFHVEPIGCISDDPRHIPYSSDKKSFQRKTGRDAFEAYQYTFRMPGDNPQKDGHVIMWDYNVGLVRITALFKSLKHSKTMPAKVMSANSGLREISHSITGGSIGAQGYWVPFEAAKAVAATFCWEIRYALTPVFGLDFPDSCIEPSNPVFMCLKIDKDIIRSCAEAASRNRAQSQEASLVGGSQTLTSTNVNSRWTPKLLKPKTADIESGYGSDSDRSPLGSPTSSGSNQWTPINIPRSSNWAQSQYPSPAKSLLRTPPPSSMIPNCIDKSKKTLKVHGLANDDSSSEVSTLDGPPAPKRQKIMMNTCGTSKEQLSKQEVLAALTLMKLHRADKSMAQRVRAMSRRASA